MNEKYYWIWISRIKGIGIQSINKLLNHFESIKLIYEASEEKLLNIKGIGEKLLKEISNKKYKETMNQYINYMKCNNIDFLIQSDKNYPKGLLELYDAPLWLYVKGNKIILNNIGVAIVGCREASEYGKKIAYKLSYNLAQNDINIISGIAKGIDSQSHIGCLNAKGKTIAVLGTPIDKIYPIENVRLFNRLLKEGGCLVSEYSLDSEVNKYNFIARNRIISGLANKVIVVEAKEKSGTLLTVEFALEQGKDVYVVPGNVYSKNSKGTNNLIKEGAKVLTNIRDLYV